MIDVAAVEHLVRFCFEGGVWLGLLEGDMVRPFTGASLAELGSPGKPVPLKAVDLLLPVQPYQIFGIGLNHPGATPSRPERPTFFSKSHSALCGSSHDVAMPWFASELIAEAELAVVIASQLSKASPEEAAASVAGLLLANDMTALPIDPWHLFEAKAADSFAPIGRSIMRGLDMDDVVIELSVNGQVEARGSTCDLYRRPAEVLSALSQTITLMPGDVVLTGAVAISRPLLPGDDITIAIPGVTTLSNHIAGPPSSPPC